jgi:pSer/pThr/pTyr-binding forkhead associated (FHA) protein
MFKLIIQDDEGKTTVVPLIRDEITIGRKEGNTIRLTERNVSRKHARLVKASGSVLIEDLDSYNGIRVNGTRIQGRVPVAETDRIQIGDYLLELKVDRAAAGTNGAAGGFEEQRTVPIERAEAGAPTIPMSGASALTVPTGPPSNMPTPPALPKASEPSLPPVALPDDPTKPTTVRGPEAVAALVTPPVAPAAEPIARMVCLSNNFAGKEWTLDKPAMVIGRTDDNDVVVNHRSISRHHAKIVREHGRFAIVDLQSSNGVRVNGEEYGKVELRRGDLVDLGHVRLRFVEPGEDFVFARDGTVVDLAAESGKKTRLSVYIALAAVVLGGVAVVLFMGQRNDPSDPSPIAATAPDAPPPVVVPTGPADADTQVAVPTPPDNPPAPTVEVAEKLGVAKKAIDGEDWSGALAAADATLRLEPSNEEAKRIAEQARKESAAQTTYDDLRAALKARKTEDAARLFAKLPADSVYRVKAEGQLEALVRSVAEIAPAREDAIAAIARRCVAARPKEPTPREPAPPKDPTPKEPTPREPADPARVEAVYSEAKQAWINGQLGVAIKKADEALAMDPGHQGAALVGGVAACKMKKVDLAKRYAAKLQGARKTQLKQTCQQEGVDL